MALSPTSSRGTSGVLTVAATDASIVVAGTATAPTVATGTLDVIATTHPPAAAVALNAKKITGLAVATASTDAASLANTLDQFGAPAAAVAMNAQKITGLSNGAAATDAAAFGQVGQSAAQVATAVGGVIWTIVTKSGDQSIASSATLTNDTELLFTAASGGMYEFEIDLVYGSPAGAGTPDIKVALGEDTNVRGSTLGLGLTVADAGAGNVTGVANNVSQSFGTAAADRIAYIVGCYVGGGGVFHVLWAQVNTGVNATIVRAGSVLRYRRVL